MICTEKAKTPKLFDVVVTDTFRTNEDITFPGNLIVSGTIWAGTAKINVLGDLIICEDAHFAANDIEVGGNLYVLGNEDNVPHGEVFSAKIHGSYYSNRGDSFYAYKFIALEGCETDFPI